MDSAPLPAALGRFHGTIAPVRLAVLEREPKPLAGIAAGLAERRPRTAGFAGS